MQSSLPAAAELDIGHMTDLYRGGNCSYQDWVHEDLLCALRCANRGDVFWDFLVWIF